MLYYIVGLGNPGEEYHRTRHNTGRIVLERFSKDNSFPQFEYNKKLNALVSERKIEKENIMLVSPETFMNKSGSSLKTLITSVKKAQKLVVIHDDIDLPLGAFKIVYNRGSGGHKGVESIIRTVKTNAFLRIKVGVSPTTPTGKIRKPQPKAGPPRAEKGAREKAVVDFIIGEFKPLELKKIHSVSRKLVPVITTIVSKGKDRAMNEFN